MATNMLSSGALAEVAGPLKDFAEKLGGSDGPMWFSAFKRFLRKENPWVLKLIRQMPLVIGGVSANGLADQLGAGGNEVSARARDIMPQPAFTTLPKPTTTLDLVWITVRDLGFDEEPTTEELFHRIKEVGDLCPAEVGPHLRLADKDQQCGSWYWVAMDPITDSDGNSNVWRVGRNVDGARWLDASYAHPRGRWGLDFVIVFVLRK